MFDRADAFVALPGGVGTLEELVEQLTWVQLGRHTKPVVIADIGGFWRPLLSRAHMRNSGLSGRVRVALSRRRAGRDVLPMISSALARQTPAGKVETIDPRL